jgi:hypothetical protein
VEYFGLCGFGGVALGFDHGLGSPMTVRVVTFEKEAPDQTGASLSVTVGV